MALAMSFLFVPVLSAQTVKKVPLKTKVTPPKTSEELVNKDQESKTIEKNKTQIETSNEASAPEENSSEIGAAPRSLQKHGIGLGIGETFLLGGYAKHGNDKITGDLFYTYAASYSFDLLVNAHYSEHRDDNERMKIAGVNTSIKSRLYEFDNFSPFFVAGLGFYSPRAKRKMDGTHKWSDSKLTFGANFGGGIDLRVNSQYTFGILGQMHWPFKVEQEGQDDLTGYYFKLLLTGTYFFE